MIQVTAKNWNQHARAAIQHMAESKYITDAQQSLLNELLISTPPKEIVNRFAGEGIRLNDIARAFAKTLEMSFFNPNEVEVQARTENFILSKDHCCYLANPFDTTAFGIISRQVKTDIKSWGVVPLNVLAEGESANKTVINNFEGTTKAIEQLIINCFDEGGSDVHLLPRDNGVIHVRYRIDGTLRYQAQIPLKDYWDWAGVLMRMCNLNAGEYIRPFDGRFLIWHGKRRIPVRLAGIETTVSGTKVPKFTLRLLSSKIDLIALDILGFSSIRTNPQFRQMTESFRRPYGMCIVTGPTGSGKSTTLFAGIRYMMARRPGDAFYTLEDPVEAEIPGAAQIQCHSDEKFGPTFSTGLRNLLRQDPDTILLGEIRDQETAELAVKASITGHRLLTTLHANSAPGAASRLRDMGVDPALMADAMVMVSAQRILPKVCQKCSIQVPWGKVITDPEETEAFRQFDLNAEFVERYKDASDRYRRLRHFVPAHIPVRITNPKGCTECHHRGVRGRLLIAEVLQVTSSLKQIIAKPGSTESEIYEDAVKNGSFLPMWEHAFQCIADGTLTLDAAEDGLGPLPLPILAESRQGDTSAVPLSQTATT